MLGASGKTGRILVSEALQQGLSVTVLVRNVESFEPRQGLTVVEGTPLNMADLEKAMRATKDRPVALVSTLGQTRKSGNPWSAPTSPPRFMADAIKNAIAVAKKFSIQKLIVMSMFGVGDSFKNLNIVMRGIMNYSNMAQTVEDHDLVDKLVKESGLNFVLVRPAMLKDGGDGPVKDLGDRGEKASFMPSISSKAVVSVLLEAAEMPNWDRRTPVLSL